MSMQTVPVGFISPWSPDPVGDAKAAMQQSAPGAPISWTYWNDPQIALGQGTGCWQFKGVAYYTPPGAADQAMYVVGCAGIDATSVGGPLRSPAPAFAGMTPSKGPLNGAGSPSVFGSANSISGGVVVMAQTLSGTNGATIVSDLNTALQRFSLSGSAQWAYYYDPQTSVGHGTGIWMIQGKQWSSNSYTAMGVVQARGCALNSVGGCPAMPAPATFPGWPVYNAFPFL